MQPEALQVNFGSNLERMQSQTILKTICISNISNNLHLNLHFKHFKHLKQSLLKQTDDTKCGGIHTADQLPLGDLTDVIASRSESIFGENLEEST